MTSGRPTAPVVEHRSGTVDGMDWGCVEGDCDHDHPDECIHDVLVCLGCYDAILDENPEYEGPLPAWPCKQSGDTK
jgi:hypothetical protein